MIKWKSLTWFTTYINASIRCFDAFSSLPHKDRPFHEYSLVISNSMRLYNVPVFINSMGPAFSSMRHNDCICASDRRLAEAASMRQTTAERQ
ncbi:hypothetical protein DM02DRAFT_52181 [Periconia macrospinosa]|uniref:Uncharacterized protein n=1 Tax=Periconia macrospinosa TaxID=97972 RepID=A0A2V1DJJ5_9PLEO|nr:hypothetical protein DM02DRAFT_52181 [Periconia macrospinosa]